MNKKHLQVIKKIVDDTTYTKIIKALEKEAKKTTLSYNVVVIKTCKVKGETRQKGYNFTINHKQLLNRLNHAKIDEHSFIRELKTNGFAKIRSLQISLKELKNEK